MEVMLKVGGFEILGFEGNVRVNKPLHRSFFYFIFLCLGLLV